MGFENIREKGLCSLPPTPSAFLNMLKNIWQTGHIFKTERLWIGKDKNIQNVAPNIFGRSNQTSGNDYRERSIRGKEDEDD